MSFLVFHAAPSFIKSIYHSILNCTIFIWFFNSLIFKTTEDGSITNIFKELTSVKSVLDDLDKGTLRSVIKSFNNTSLSVEDLSERFGGLDESVVSYLNSTKKGSANIDDLSKSINNSASSMDIATIKAKALSMALNVGIWLAISAGIQAVTWALDELIVTSEEQKKKLEDSIKAYEQSQTELQNINDELKTTSDRIDELNKKDNLSFVEQDELDKLVQSNSELERKLYLLDQVNKEAEKDVAREAQKTYDNFIDNRNIGSVDQIDFYANSNLLNNSNLDSYKDDLSWLIAQYKNQQTVLEEAQNNNWSNIEDNARNSLELLTSYIVEAQKDYQSLFDTISDINDESISEPLKVAKIDLDKILEITAELLGYGGERSEKIFNNIWNSDEFETSKKALLEIANLRGVTPDDLNSNKEYSKLLSETGKSSEELASHINSIADAQDNISTTSNQIPLLSQQLTNNKDILDEYQSNIQKISDTLSSLSNDALSASEALDILQFILEMDSDFDIGMYKNADGTYDFNNALQDLLITLTTKASNQLPNLANQISEIGKEALESAQGVDSLSTSISNMESIQKLMDSVKESMKDNSGLITADILSSIISKYPELESAVAAYNAKLITSQQLYDELQKRYDIDLKNFQAVNRAKLYANDTYYKSILSTESKRIEQLSKSYNVDLKNYKTLAHAKAAVENELLSSLGSAWSKYYNIVLGDNGIYKTVAKYNADSYEAQNDPYLAEMMDRADQLDIFYKQLADVFKLDELNFSNVNLDFSTGKSNSSSATIFDWIERKIEVAEKAIDRLNSKLESTSDYTMKSKYTKEIISSLKDELALLDKAHSMYMNLANSVGLSSGYVSKIQSGALDIDSISDSKLKSRIEDYKKWYDAAEDVTTSINDINKELKELNESLKDIELEKFESIASIFDDQVTVISENLDKLNSQIKLFESQGIIVSEKLYREMISKTQNQLDLLYSKRVQLINSMNTSISTISNFTNTSQWYEMVNAINAVDDEIKNAEISLSDFNNSIKELKWDNFNHLVDRLSGVNSELENLVGLLSNYDLTDSDGNLTNESIAKIGLLAQQYELASYEVTQYAEKIDELNKAYRDGEYSTVDYFEKLQELNEAQWESVNAAESIKDAIIEVAKARVDSEIKSIEDATSEYEKLIKSQIDLLKAEKDLNDFRDKVIDKQKDITQIEKELLAISTDSSQEATAKRAKLQAELAKAQEELSKIEKDQSYKDRETALNKELERYKELQDNKIIELEEYLEDEDQVISDYMDIAQNNAGTIANTLEQLAKKHGVKISTSIIDPWKKGVNAISDYSSKLSSSSSAFTKNLNGIKDSVLALITTSDGLAQSFIDMFNVSTSNFSSSLLGIEDILKRINELTGQSTSSTGRWFQDANNGKWWYENADGSYTTNGWQNIDGKDYYFDKDGWMLANTTTPDEYKVGSDGAWDGKSTTGSNSSSSGSSSSSKSGLVSSLAGYIKYGDTGDKVKNLQTALSDLGYNIGSTGVDGKFGASTLSALKQFQSSSNVKVDGIVGSETKNAFKAKGYDTGGVVSVIKPANEDTLIGINNKERVLTANQNRAFEKFVYDDMEDMKTSFNMFRNANLSSNNRNIPIPTGNQMGNVHIETHLAINGDVNDKNVDKIIKETNANTDRKIEDAFKRVASITKLKNR